MNARSDEPKQSILPADGLIALAISFGLFFLLLSQLMVPGITWDEAAPGIVDAKNQAQWLSGLFTLEHPFSKTAIDHYWTSRSDHPSLWRTVAGISYLLFSGFVDEIIAFRAPTAAMYSILAGTMFIVLRWFLPRFPAFAGALSLVFMPRLFGHAHIYSLDIAIACFWFWTAMVGYAALQGKVKTVWFGVFYAIAFTTKLHAVFIPFPLLAWAGMAIWLDAQNRRERLHLLLRACGWAMALTPIIYVALQPFLWVETWARLAERFFDYAEKTTARPIPLYYLGARYGNDTPWHYPLVMVGATIPAGFLLCLFVGILSPVLNRMHETWEAIVKGWNANGAIYLLFLLNFLTPLMVVLLPLAQAYDGCRLFLPCFPFAAALIGIGFHALIRMFKKWLHQNALSVVLMASLSLSGALELHKAHPCYLAYYNEIVGGIRGAKDLGFETTYWCDGLSKEFLDQINSIIPPNKTMKPLSMSDDVIRYYQARGWLRNDINIAALPPYDFHLLQARQGMFTQTEWFLYMRKRPVAVCGFKNAPLFLLYDELD